MPARVITSRAVKGTEPTLPLSVYWRLVHGNPSLVAERKAQKCRQDAYVRSLSNFISATSWLAREIQPNSDIRR